MVWRTAHVRFANSTDALLPASHAAALQDLEVRERPPLQYGLGAGDRGSVANLWLDVREEGSEGALERSSTSRLKLAPVSDV